MGNDGKKYTSIHKRPFNSILEKAHACTCRQGHETGHAAYNKVHLDTSNPRIRKFLEMYPGEPTPLQIYLALGAATDDASDSSTSFEKLKNSIKTNGGIIQPIIVNRKPDGTFLCIEGNTRLAELVGISQ